MTGGLHRDVELACDLNDISSLPGEFSHRMVGHEEVRGELVGVDLDRVLQQRGSSGEFRFESLAGDFAVEAKRVELSRLRLQAPSLKAGGELGFDAQGTASGRLAVEALTPGPRRALNLKLGGSLATPNYQR